MSPNFFATRETDKGNWIWVYQGLGNYLLYYRKTSDRAVVLSGGTDTESFTAPFSFKLKRIDFESDDTTKKDITVYHKPIKYPSQTYSRRIFETKDNVQTDLYVKFDPDIDIFDLGDTIEFSLVGTSTKKLWIKILIQRVK